LKTELSMLGWYLYDASTLTFLDLKIQNQMFIPKITLILKVEGQVYVKENGFN